MTCRTADLLWAIIALAGCSAPASARADPAASRDEAGPEQPQAPEPRLLAEAMKASPATLAKAYLASGFMIELTEIASGNVQIHTPEGTIDERSAKAKRREFEKRMLAYRHAITQRGFAAVAGEYSMISVTPACSKSGSMWLGGAQERMFDKYEITQDGFEVTLLITVAVQPGVKDDIGAFELGGAVVESALVFHDPMNTDYFLEGQWADGVLELRPNLDVLRGWPSWAGPPKKQDLQECLLVLKRTDSE